jgi:hypothetical protein
MATSWHNPFARPRTRLPRVLPTPIGSAIDLSATYAAAERFVDVALRRDDLLFTPGRPIWSMATLQELDRRYVQAPDPGEGTFED